MFQIQAIKVGQQQLTEEIETFKTLKNETIEKDLERMRMQRDILDGKIKDCDIFVKTSHVAKVVEERLD